MKVSAILKIIVGSVLSFLMLMAVLGMIINPDVGNSAIFGIIICLFLGIGLIIWGILSPKKVSPQTSKSGNHIIKTENISKSVINQTANKDQVNIDIMQDDTQESVIATIVKVADVAWGGFMNLHITRQRIIVESLLGSGSTALAYAAGGAIGLLFANKAADKKANDLNSNGRSIDEILKSSNKNYSINLDDVITIELKKQALPIGHSRCKIQTSKKKITFAFKRDYYDDVTYIFNDILPEKTKAS